MQPQTVLMLQIIEMIHATFYSLLCYNFSTTDPSANLADILVDYYTRTHTHTRALLT